MIQLKNVSTGETELINCGDISRIWRDSGGVVVVYRGSNLLCRYEREGDRDWQTTQNICFRVWGNMGTIPGK